MSHLGDEPRPMPIMVEHPGRDSAAVLRLRGDVDRAAAGELYLQLEALSRAPDVDEVVLDFAGAGTLDTAGAAAVSAGRAQLDRRGRALRVTGLGAGHEAVLGVTMAPSPAPPAPVPHAPALERLGEHALAWWAGVTSLAALVARTARMAGLAITRRRALPRGAVPEQAVLIGVRALPIVGLLSFLLGLILAFQSAYQLREFGATIYVADLVSVAMVREFAPMMTAIILAGRSGAAIAAELGTMKVQEELDALRTMGLDPTHYLVLPRIAALTLVQPALTLMAIFIGVGGGVLIAWRLLDISPLLFYQRAVFVLDASDFWITLIKSVVFAWIIGFAAAHMGLAIRGGASGVGRATTRAVVASIFWIIVADSVFATFTTSVQR